MSQYLLNIKNHPRIQQILIGWDRPLQQFFLVLYENPNQDSHYSNLLDDTPNKTLKYFCSLLQEYGIQLPIGLITELKEDAANNVGNKERTYTLENTK